METSTKTLDEIVEIQSSRWTEAPGYTPDDLLDAFNEGLTKGRAQGRKEVLRATLEEFRTNLSSALREAERLYLDIWSRVKIRPESIFVRVVAPAPTLRVEALYLVPAEDFLGPAMLSAYDLAGEREDEIAMGSGIELFFRFMPDSPNTDVAAIHADGFGFRYSRDRDEGV